MWRLVYQKQVSRAGTSNYIQQYLWDVITCPRPWYLLPVHRSSYQDLTQECLVHLVARGQSPHPYYGSYKARSGHMSRNPHIASSSPWWPRQPSKWPTSASWSLSMSNYSRSILVFVIGNSRHKNSSNADEYFSDGKMTVRLVLDRRRTSVDCRCLHKTFSCNSDFNPSSLRKYSHL